MSDRENKQQPKDKPGKRSRRPTLYGPPPIQPTLYGPPPPIKRKKRFSCLVIAIIIAIGMLIVGAFIWLFGSYFKSQSCVYGPPPIEDSLQTPLSPDHGQVK